MGKIQNFFKEELGNLRMVQGADGEPWFVLKDICDILGATSSATPTEMAQKLDESEKGLDIVETLGGPQEMITVSEGGLYYLICTSRKPKAKEFRLWVTGTVLTSIRKNGGYIDGQEDLPAEDAKQLLTEAQERLAELKERNRVLRQKNTKLAQILNKKNEEIWRLEDRVASDAQECRRRVDNMDWEDVLAAGYYN